MRDVIPLKSVDAALLLDKTTGYIKINRFAETTADEFNKALISLKKKLYPRKLILPMKLMKQLQLQVEYDLRYQTRTKKSCFSLMNSILQRSLT